MKKQITGIFLIMILCGYMCSVPIYAKENPDELKNLYAQSAVLMDADSGRILFGKNENNILPMASTTKIMTCIIALENMENDQICEISDEASKQPKVRLGVKQGEKYYLQDLLYSLMLESHNDSAVAIAEAIAGNVDEFARLMNEKAQEIGCTNTYFITPNGLDAQDDVGTHSTTAEELALIMRYCICQSSEKEKFIEITQKASHEFSDVSGKRKMKCSNHNALLNMMEGAVSGKTGFTNDAGYCYVGALRQGKRTFIVALLACGWPNNKDYKWKDTKKLLQYGLENYEYQNVWKEVEINDILVLDGVNELDLLEKTVYTKNEVQNDDSDLQFLMKQNEDVEVKIIQRQTCEAPVSENTVVGKVFYMLDGKIMKAFDIVTKNRIEKNNVSFYIRFITCKILLSGKKS